MWVVEGIVHGFKFFDQPVGWDGSGNIVYSVTYFVRDNTRSNFVAEIGVNTDGLFFTVAYVASSI